MTLHAPHSTLHGLRVAHYRRRHGSDLSGADSYLLSVAKYQKACGLDPVVVANPGALTLKLAEEVGLATAAIEIESALHVPSFPRRFAHLIRCEGVGLVHTHYNNPFWAALGCRLAGVPLVCSLHRAIARTARPDGRTPRRGIPLRRWLQLALADRLIPVSLACRDWYVAQGISASRMTVVYNGIDPAVYSTGDRQSARREWGIPDDAFVFGTVGALAPRKGYEYLIEAGARVSRKRPDARLVIVGDGELRPKLQALGERLGLGERCRFTGFRLDIPRMLSGFDCFVLSSLQESFGMVLAEAMATGLPTVATRVGGIPEVVVHGQTGYLAEPRSVAELEAAMLRMMEDPHRAWEMGHRGRRRIENQFTVARTVTELTSVYREVLDQRQPRGEEV